MIRSLALAIAFVVLLLAGCTEDQTGSAAAPTPSTPATTNATATPPAAPPVVANARPRLAEWQRELLELAFTAASAMPAMPHIKDRSRAQETVVAACLQLEQPSQALQYLQQIDNWRRGACYADLAFHLVERGDTRDARDYLERAEKIATEEMKQPTAQEWRRDRIRAKIARTQLLLGNHDEVRRHEQGLAGSELVELAAAKAGQLAEQDFDLQLQAIDTMLGADPFDPARGALWSCAKLHDRFYGDPGRRDALAGRVENGYPKLPAGERLLLLFELGAIALRHQDPARALAVCARAQQVVDGASWLPPDRIRVDAQLAGLRGQAGDAAGGRRIADAALALYETEKPRIQGIDRASVLRPLAEAYRQLGSADVAMAVYRLAVEAGAENPNARPRAEDLVATCIALAVTGCEPDPALRRRLQEIGDNLGSPW